ncbi:MULTISPECIES: hypothetical protein [Kordiimonas]|uniref:Uncharacterized protein n=1 Tax=Kordiimonas lacus TaxID=637679 RepID=A0A1G6TSH7_9PROT|nr:MULTISPECIES: hypothetical protein [Kordiimonas]SDD31979.1 hypothetical protein SAMN04488071_0339 [Kordiimonas lacus]
MAQENLTQESAASDLALIREMMEAGKRRVAFNGTHLIIWGGVLMVGFFAQFLAVVGRLPDTVLGIWGPVLAVGWGLEFFLFRGKAGPSEKNLPILAHATSWLAVGLGTMIYFGISLAFGTFEPKAITLISTALIGSAFFVTAAMTGVKWLNVVTAGWWGLMAYVAHQATFDAEMLLVMAVATGLLLSLPGFLMRRLAPAGE